MRLTWSNAFKVVPGTIARDGAAQAALGAFLEWVRLERRPCSKNLSSEIDGSDRKARADAPPGDKTDRETCVTRFART